MKLEVFEKIITGLADQQKKSMDTHALGIDLMEYESGWNEIAFLLISAYYGDEGQDWISWYLYERESFSGDILSATDENGEPICYDIPSLWKQVEEYRVSERFVEYSLPKKREMSDKDFEDFLRKMF